MTIPAALWSRWGSLSPTSPRRVVRTARTAHVEGNESALLVLAPGVKLLRVLRAPRKPTRCRSGNRLAPRAIVYFVRCSLPPGYSGQSLLRKGVGSVVAAAVRALIQRRGELPRTGAQHRFQRDADPRGWGDGCRVRGGGEPALDAYVCCQGPSRALHNLTCGLDLVAVVAGRTAHWIPLSSVSSIRRAGLDGGLARSLAGDGAPPNSQIFARQRGATDHTSCDRLRQ